MNGLSVFWSRLFSSTRLTDQELLDRSEWEEVDGEPMNAYALEYMRRYDGFWNV